MKYQLINNKSTVLNDARMKLMMLATFIMLLVASHYAFATDLLAGTDADIKDTLTTTGKHWLLYIDGIAALMMFALRKNVMVLGSVLVITLFTNVLLFMAK